MLLLLSRILLKLGRKGRIFFIINIDISITMNISICLAYIRLTILFIIGISLMMRHHFLNIHQITILILRNPSQFQFHLILK